MQNYTSVVAYREHVLDGKATSQRQRILNCLLAYDRPINRSDLADLFQNNRDLIDTTWDHGPEIPLASICGRLNVLIASGLVRVVDERTDPRTGHRVEYVEAVRPTPDQKSFDGFVP